MQGKILIVDAIVTNRISIKVKLKEAYLDVAYAASMAEAMENILTDQPVLVIAALSLPDGGAAELCHRLRQNQTTAHIPVIAIAPQSTAEDRMATLSAGVQDILHQPVDEKLLLARVRNLIRARNAAAEWQLRDDTCRALGLAEAAAGFEDQGNCVMVGSDRMLLQKFAAKLRPALTSRLSLSSPASLMQGMTADHMPDVLILILPSDTRDAMADLRLISALRASARAHHTGVIVVQSRPDPALGAHALDLGADDLMPDGFCAPELALRTKAVMRRKRMGEQLRASVRNGLEAAVFDPLTGLYNRRYAMPHLERIAEHARATRHSFAVMAADLDHFKRINDAYGHASGDAVLVEVGTRLRCALRSSDMVARIGGEEFLVIMPGTGQEEARQAALRICTDISAKPFTVPGSPTPISVTISIGMAIGGGDPATGKAVDKSGRSLLDEADSALYAAKGRGRNQVKFGRPAA